MKLEFLGHDERYIVEQSLMTLFPLEKPTYDAVQPEDEAWCRLAAGETAADCQVSAELHYHGYTAAGTFASPLTGTDFEKEGQRRYAVAACFYLAFLDLYPKLPEALRAAEKLTLPPWGMLHRRPARQAHHTGADGGQDPGGSQAGAEDALFRP